MNQNIIVIPTYNEKSNVVILLEKIFTIFSDIHVMVVDDNSPDGTAKTVQGLMPKYPHLSLMERKQKDGLGRAYVAAFQEILKDRKFDTLTMMDADLSHDPEHLPALLDLAKSYDTVIGSRYIPRGGVTKKWGLWRRFLSAAGNLYLRIIFFRYPIHDWTTGYNTIKTDMLRKLNLDLLSPRGYAFISSLKYYLAKNGASIKESPIFFEERNGGESKMSSSIILEGILTPWKIIFQNLFSGFYKL